MSRRHATLAAALFLATACSDPTGPCDGAHACEVTGVDLAIIDARIVDGERTGTDHVTGLPVYRAGPVTVEFTIVNRGDSISGPQPLTSTDLVVPPLAPGEIARIRMTKDFTGDMHLHYIWSDSPVDPRAADVRSLSLALLQRSEDNPPEEWPVADNDPSNNTLESPRFHVAMPVLTATMSDISGIRENAPFVMSFRIENVSVHNAHAPAFDVVLCLNLACYSNGWTYFGRFEVPGIDAGWRYENAYLATMDVSSMATPREARPAIIYLCIVARDHESDFMPQSPSHSCIAARQTVTRPDYERCEPAVLQIGVPHTMAQANCGDFESTSTGRRFSVLALDAVAGRTYIVDGAPPYLYNANGENADLPGPGLAVAESGRYYLVFVGPGPISITVTESD